MKTIVLLIVASLTATSVVARDNQTDAGHGDEGRQNRQR